MKALRSFLVLALLVLGPFLGWWARGRLARPTDKKTGDTLNISLVVRGRLEQKVKARGIVKPAPNALVRVGFPMPKDVARRISKLTVVEGDPVMAGQELAQLDCADIQATLQQLQADVRVFERRLDALRVLEPLEVRITKAQRDQAKSQWEQADRVHERLARLKRGTAVSDEQYDVAVNDRVVSQAKFAQLEATVQQVQAKFRTDIASLEAQVAQAKAAIQNTEVQIRWSTLYAPLDGQVFAVHQRQGELTSNLPNAPVLALLDRRQLQLHLFVDETDRGRVQVGQQVTFRVDAFPEQTFRGQVVRLLPQPILQENVVYYLAVVEVAGEQRTYLQAEMTALAFVRAGTNDKALWLPLSAVRSRSDAWYVRRPGADGPEEVPVVIGWKDEGRVEIRDGLVEGDEVLVDP